MFNSSKYWEERYVNGGNSGAGSYNHLAEFKAQIINNFIENQNIHSILELGCGDGNNLSLYKIDEYLGLDVSKKAVELCKDKYKHDRSKRFLTLSEFEKNNTFTPITDLTLSLDVIYHLIEDDIFNQYMNNLFSLSKKFVIIYSSDQDEEICIHVKHRKFTTWIANNMKEWQLKKFIKNKYPYDPKKPNETTFADFYIYEKI